MEFSRGYGDHVAKSRNFRGGGGCPARPSGTEIRGGWGVKLKKSSVGGGGYGYFLEPHICKRLLSRKHFQFFFVFKMYLDRLCNMRLQTFQNICVNGLIFI